MIFTRLATAAAFAAIAFFGSTMVTAEPIEAIAYMMGADTETNGLILGTVKLIQKDDHSSTRVVVDVKGLSEGNHGIHIHAFGDISGGKTDQTKRILFQIKKKLI